MTTAAIHPIVAGSVIIRNRQKRPSELIRRPQMLSDLDALREDQGVLHVHPEIPNRVFDLGVAEQYLNCT